METTVIQFAENSWKSIYKLGATSALLAVVVGVLEIVITFLPGGERVAPELMTVSGWFVRFQVNPLMEMRNLGLINIFLTAFGIPLFLALFAAHRRVDPGFASLAMLLSFVGAAVFFATNRAFAMYSLSEQYAAATTDIQRLSLVSAGQAMLAVGTSHSPGTFLAFSMAEIASIMMGFVILRGKVFSKTTALIGITGFSFLFVFEICSSFIPAFFEVAMLFAMIGGILSMVWYVLVARHLFKLAGKDC